MLLSFSAHGAQVAPSGRPRPIGNLYSVTCNAPRLSNYPRPGILIAIDEAFWASGLHTHFHLAKLPRQAL
jgi:hypothetical protein